MMKSFYLKVIFGCVCGLLAVKAQSQLANPPYYIETEVLFGDYGEAGHDLTGYVTYKVYIQFANVNNYLTSVFAGEAQYDCIQDPDSTVHFEFPCGLFQHEFQTAYGFTQQCGLGNLIPTSEYDSYVTIGQICSSDPTCDFLGPLFPVPCSGWLNDFEGPNDNNYFDGDGFFWDEGAIFAAPCFQPYPTSASHADANGRVLIGQFTTCGDMSGCVNIQYQDQNDVDQYELNICFDEQMPCLANSMDITPDIQLAGCAGQNAEVTLDGGGNGNIDYQLFDASNVLLSSYNDQPAGLSVTPIDAGTYYITMIDAVGCRDTTANFIVEEPGALVFDATLLQDVVCFGENIGSIELECSGGTGVITVLVNNVPYDCGDILTDLACGTYDIIASDENGCDQSETIDITCPAQLVYNPITTVIDCFGDDDGSIVGNVTGGTGTIDATWVYNDAQFDSFSGASPLNISITNLDSGTYDVHIEDENECAIDDSFEITEPEELLANFPFTDVTCFGLCDGTIIPEISGGSDPYATVSNLVGGGPANLNALCEGAYAITITDDNLCQVKDTIEIAQPTDITYVLNVVPVTCFGQCDGEIQLTDVLGSFENFTYVLTPNAGNCEAPCAGGNTTFTELCAGTYDVLISDENGCPKNVDNIVIETPAELQIVMVPTDVTCFGLSDGEVFIEVIGGTAPIIITPSDSIAPATLGELAPGLYSYTVTDANGCFTTEDVIIEQPDSLYASSLATENASCGGTCDGTLSYQVFGGVIPYDYNLLPTGNTGPVNGFLSSLCANEYQLVIQDIFNCSDTLEFEILEPDSLVITSLLNAPTCTGMFDGSAEIQISGGTGELTLFIEPEDTDILEIDSVTFSLSGLGEGELYFELVDEENCALLDTLEIVPDIITDMVFTLFSTPETCWNEVDGTATVAVQNGFLPINYLWDDEDAQTTATASGLASNQEYTVIVTDDIGCTLTASVFVDPTVGCFFIATAITPNGDGVNDTWILGGLEFYTDSKINVFNRWGQTVFSSKGYNSNWDATYQGQLLPVADYYFTIDYADDKDVIMGTVTIKY